MKKKILRGQIVNTNNSTLGFSKKNIIVINTGIIASKRFQKMMDVCVGERATEKLREIWRGNKNVK